MAAAPGLLLWLLLLGPHWWDSGQPDPSDGRRFSDLKVCADEECSMLMYHGEALADFTGPDCRFVNFKKGDHVYVYYKLAGEFPELWAGSVGRIFGYFPKDLIKVLHKYTEEELYIPADETDFVCFEGGRDDFNNYNVKELLGSLELEDSTAEESEKAEEVSQHGVKSPEGPQETELDPAREPQPEPEAEPAKVDSGELEGVFSENTEELQEQSSAQESHPLTNSAADSAQGVQSSLDNFEEMLHDKLKVPGSENRTSNSSPVSVEQEKIDAYKVLKTEMTLDLKTKFGSTADVLVSDDEATSLVTSLEDDLNEEPDAEYYSVENEEEENADSFDELPLLSFTDEEENVPRKPRMEKSSTDENPHLSEDDEVKPPLPPGTQNDNKDILTTWGDTFFSIVTGGEGETGVVDLESSNPEEDKKEGVLVSASHQRKPQSTAAYMDPEDEEDDLFVEDSKRNGGKDSKTDPELVITGEEKAIQESRGGLAHQESKPETSSAYPTHNSKLNPLPAAEKAKELTLKAVFERKENGLKEPVIHISKETLHENKNRDGIESELLHRAPGSPVTENNSKQESLGAVPLLGDSQPDASKDRMEVPGASVNGPEVGQWEGFQNQPTFSSPEETGLPRELETKVPPLGRNLSWQQQERDVSVAEGREDPADVKPPHPQAIQGTQEADSAEVPSVRTQRPEAEEDDFPLEELLEDENAVSAQQSKENHPRAHDSSDINSQSFEKVILGTLNLDAEESKQATNTILEIGKKRETTSEEADGMGKESGSVVVDKEGSHLAGVSAQGPSEVDGLPEKTAAHTPGFGEVVQSKDPNDPQKDNPEALVNTLGLEIPGGEEISEWELEDSEELGGSESQGPDAQNLGDDPPQQATPEIPDIVLKSVREDLPIINSFFRDQRSLYRFLKYFDVHELEGMLQDMSIRLKSAHRDSLPYNVEKVLDKVFRASESRILSVAENMLDTRENKNRDVGTRENSVLEEAAVLDDVQDLIYFVRYQYSGVETAPLATPPPQEEVWSGPVEELQPPMKDSLPQENTEDNVRLPEQPGSLDQPATRVQFTEESGLSHQPVTSVQLTEEPGLSDQPVTRVQLPEELGQPVTEHMSASWVSQKSNSEKDIDPAFLVTKSSPVGVGDDAETLPETKAEEPANVPPLENELGPLYSFILYLSKMSEGSNKDVDCPANSEERLPG